MNDGLKTKLKRKSILTGHVLDAVRYLCNAPEQREMLKISLHGKKGRDTTGFQFSNLYFLLLILMTYLLDHLLVLICLWMTGSYFWLLVTYKLQQLIWMKILEELIVFQRKINFWPWPQNFKKAYFPKN